MPGEDGFTTCMKLKDNPQTREIPIIFISALNDTENIVRGLETGGVDYIVKPFSRSEVLARVNVHLRLKFALENMIESQAQKLAAIKDVQQSFLVRPEDLPEANFFYVHRSVLEAGGDFLDVISVGENSFAYIVADISGHDLGTAYLISALKVLFNQNINAFTPLEESLRMINAVFATDVCNVELEDKKIIFFIEYPGSGFDWNKLLEQTDIDKNKETTSHAPTHGWGLFLLKKCCSAIKYYGIGNKLSFWFNFDNKI